MGKAAALPSLITVGRCPVLHSALRDGGCVAAVTFGPFRVLSARLD